MLTNSLSKQKKNILNSVPGSEVINITKHVDEYTVKTERGDFIRCFELVGIEYQTSSDDQIKSFALMKKRMLKALHSADTALWFHHIHEKYDETLESHYDNDLIQQIFDDYNAGLKDVYINRFFVSVVMRGIDSLDSIRAILDKKGVQTSLELNLNKINSKSKIIENDLSGTLIRPLFLKKHNNIMVSEIANLYGRIYNGEWKNIPITYNDLNETIPSNGVFFHRESIEQRGINKTKYGAILSVKDYDGHNNLNQFNDLLGLPFPFIMTQSFTFLTQMQAEYAIKNVQKEQRAVDDTSDTGKELNDLLKALNSGESVFGSFHTTFFSSDSDINQAADNLDNAESILRNSGLIMTRAFIDAESCFLAQLPGNFKEITYSVNIKNDNFSSFAFMHNTRLGDKVGNHWGNAICLGKTSDGTATYINFHEGDTGHFTILGSTGSGKTVLQNMLLLFSQKFNPSLSIFDSKHNAQPLINILGGNYYDFVIGHETGLAPFQMEPTPKNLMFLKDLVQMMAEFVEKELTIEQINEISWAVDSMMSDAVDKNDRSITGLIKFFPNQGEGNLHDRLIMWTKGYKLGWVFDSTDEAMDLSYKYLGFNMDGLMGQDNTNSNNVASLITSYLWHRIEEKKTGERGIIVFEEYHQLLSHPLMVEKMGKGLKMDRDKEFLYGFTSQSVSDALNSPISSAIKEQISTYFLLSNPNGVYDEYKQINITQEEFNVIKNAEKTSRSGIYKQGHRSVIMDFNANSIKRYMPLLSSNKVLNNLFHQCKKDYGDDWVNHYLKGAINA